MARPAPADNWRVDLAASRADRGHHEAKLVQEELEVRLAEDEAFLSRRWVRELDYRLVQDLWAFTGDRIAVRFAYEWHDDSGNWFRSYGNENWP